MSQNHTSNPLLSPLSDNLWTANGSLRFPGVEFGCRMTVIRQSSGALLLHSPVRLHIALRDEINKLGEVSEFFING